jgi:hypothetical protein
VAVPQVDLYTCGLLIRGTYVAHTMARMVRNNVSFCRDGACRIERHVDVQSSRESAVVLINGWPLTKSKLPIEGWLLLLMKTLFDKELSVSENSVRPARILHNSSLIMGKQIINILPEGYVYSRLHELFTDQPQVPQ